MFFHVIKDCMNKKTIYFTGIMCLKKPYFKLKTQNIAHKIKPFAYLGG